MDCFVISFCITKRNSLADSFYRFIGRHQLGFNGLDKLTVGPT